MLKLGICSSVSQFSFWCYSQAVGQSSSGFSCLWEQDGKWKGIPLLCSDSRQLIFALHQCLLHNSSKAGWYGLIPFQHNWLIWINTIPADTKVVKHWHVFSYLFLPWFLPSAHFDICKCKSSLSAGHTLAESRVPTEGWELGSPFFELDFLSWVLWAGFSVTPLIKVGLPPITFFLLAWRHLCGVSPLSNILYLWTLLNLLSLRMLLSANELK